LLLRFTDLKLWLCFSSFLQYVYFSGTQWGVFKIMLILDLWITSSHAAVVIVPGMNFLFKSGHWSGKAMRNRVDMVGTIHDDLLKVKKSQKQFMISSILPKNERNSLSWVKKMLRIVSFVRFLGPCPP
jgi:hypothetical protein